MGVGVDLVCPEEVEHAMRCFGDRYLERVYTPGELAAAGGSPRRLAERFAAKEAVFKALRLPADDPVVWQEVEIDDGRVRLHGRLAAARPGARVVVSDAGDARRALAVALCLDGAP